MNEKIPENVFTLGMKPGTVMIDYTEGKAFEVTAEGEKIKEDPTVKFTAAIQPISEPVNVVIPVKTINKSSLLYLAGSLGMILILLGLYIICKTRLRHAT
ncbi:MAG TPA: hypothetical protein PKD72_00505 [Gemmatales bacterium]|nr:hypothetical protein [Gemmatales bacterium]